MKRILSSVLLTTVFAIPTLAQTTEGGGPSVTVQSTKGTRTIPDTTQHTTLSDGTVVSTSKGKDGEPNGGAGGGGGGSTGGSGGASYEGY